MREPGKRIGGRVYVHRTYESQFPGLAQAKAKLPSYVRYDVVAYCERDGSFSFIECPGFNHQDEPVLGSSWKVYPTAQFAVEFRSPFDPWIYHHKWMFVGDEYHGFDVDASKRRSQAWESLEGVDRSRIGKLSYWRANVIPRIPRNDLVTCDGTRI